LVRLLRLLWVFCCKNCGCQAGFQAEREPEVGKEGMVLGIHSPGLCEEFVLWEPGTEIIHWDRIGGMGWDRRKLDEVLDLDGLDILPIA
jgi:hypothetical protein